jgi:uncharacterized membrane protein YgcG
VSIHRIFAARLWAPLAVALAALALCAPASARDQYVLDNAGLLGAPTVQSLNQTISDFNSQTGKEVVVVTVPSLGAKTIAQAAEDTFAQQQVNGILILLAKAEKQDTVIGDRASSAFFAHGSFSTIREAMRGYFRSGDFDTGVTTGVNLVLDTYRSHERGLGAAAGASRAPSSNPQSQSLGGFGLFWLILTLLAGFLIIRSIFRAFTGPRMMPPGYGPGPGPGFGGGPGYGPGYGGYGFGGGGGGFFSGLLGGLGGAWIGNELFNHGGNMFGGGQAAGFGGDPSAGVDASGWQSDAGQADMGNASFGGFGDSGGGGFDSGGGGW